MTTMFLFANCAVLDAAQGRLLEGHHVLVEGNRIKEVSDRPLKATAARMIEGRGRTLMPGLCDAHVHVAAVSPDLAALTKWAPSYVTARTAEVLKGMLRRGFTTVRDAGGADYGLADAIAEGYLEGPRLLFSGPALSQTGGHGDQRGKGDNSTDYFCGCVGTLGRVCDGVDAVRRVARDELRKGATQIKIMASGGIASPTDHIANTQYSLEEITAIVEEATAARTYVMAHAYYPNAIRRAIECGVRSIEHGNFIDEPTARLMVQKQAFMVPTLSTYEALAREGVAMGFPPAFADKVQWVRGAALTGLETAHKAGVAIAYGTDLLGAMHRHQALEFTLRREVQTVAEVIQGATVNAAALFNRVGEVGVVAPGALADLLLVDGDPYRDITVLQRPEETFRVIMKDGAMVVDQA
ncbi:MAG: amidohydrolase family protein [Alphaproteobacteria bacterium]|nr:amidohydrolase family protein [Alphaproteobacteria bacterium]